MKYTIITLFTILSLATACQVEESQEQSNFDFKSYFDNIAKVDNCLGEGEAFDVLGKRLDPAIKAPLDSISSTANLKKLYSKAHANQIEAGPRTNGRCVDVNLAVKGRSLQRITQLPKQEAIEGLISLYKNSELPFLGGDAKALTKAMQNCDA